MVAKRARAAVMLGAALMMASPAMAVDKMVIDIQGISPNRVIVYLNDHSADKTSVGADTLGPSQHSRDQAHDGL